MLPTIIPELIVPLTLRFPETEPYPPAGMIRALEVTEPPMSALAVIEAAPPTVILLLMLATFDVMVDVVIYPALNVEVTDAFEDISR